METLCTYVPQTLYYHSNQIFFKNTPACKSALVQKLSGTEFNGICEIFDDSDYIKDAPLLVFCETLPMPSILSKLKTQKSLVSQETNDVLNNIKTSCDIATNKRYNVERTRELLAMREKPNGVNQCYLALSSLFVKDWNEVNKAGCYFKRSSIENGKAYFTDSTINSNTTQSTDNPFMEINCEKIPSVLEEKFLNFVS